MHCANCGSKLPKRAKFCLECGIPVRVTPQSAKVRPSAESEVEEGLVFRVGSDLLPQLQAWIHEQDERVAQEQVRTGLVCAGADTALHPPIIKYVKRSLDKGAPRPYYGTFGDGYVYCFRPSSVGCEIEVKNLFSHEEILLDPGNLGFLDFESDDEVEGR